MAADEVAHAAPGFEDGDLLFHDRGDQGVQDEAGGAQAQARVAALDFAERPGRQEELLGGVGRAEQGRQALEEPVG
ncbi:hypothetical protein AB0F92_35025 [Kitasatospora aureofaciens]|uniref:hypothetical protein n=1 Tax=Kitasatospora aureofaciens TaxID=1894 RepID=UPI0033E93342